MNFHIITIFPKIFDSYFNEGIIKRALDQKIIKIKTYNLRDYTLDKHRKVDDAPYGGGAGMVMMVQPIFDCVSKIKDDILAENSEARIKVILFSAKGQLYNHSMAKEFSNKDHVIMICGRYEGVDERVAKNICDEEISIGNYVLTGGEIPAMVVVDSVSRLLPGVLGNPDSLISESHCNFQGDQFDFPVYTRPEVFNEWKVPEVLVGGNHKEIDNWRIQQKKVNKIK